MRFILPLLLMPLFLGIAFSTPSNAVDIQTLKIEGVNLEMTLGEAEDELKGQGYMLLEKERAVVRYIKQGISLVSLEANHFIDTDLTKPEAQALKLTYVHYLENVPAIIQETPDEPYECLVGKEFYERACRGLSAGACEAQGGLRGMKVKPTTSRALGVTYGMGVIVRTNRACQINLREYREMSMDAIYKYQRRNISGQ